MCGLVTWVHSSLLHPLLFSAPVLPQSYRECPCRIELSLGVGERAKPSLLSRRSERLYGKHQIEKRQIVEKREKETIP
jgi:hypothetical protein